MKWTQRVWLRPPRLGAAFGAIEWRRRAGSCMHPPAKIFSLDARVYRLVHVQLPRLGGTLSGHLALARIGEQ